MCDMIETESQIMRALSKKKQLTFFSFFSLVPVNMSPTTTNEPRRPSEDAVQSVAKRQKTTVDIASKFHSGLLEDDSRAEIRKAFMESKPYLHCKIEKLMNDDLLRRVRKEIFDNLHFTLKETDIYKVRKGFCCLGNLNTHGCSRFIKQVTWPIWMVFHQTSLKSYLPCLNYAMPSILKSSATLSLLLLTLDPCLEARWI